MWVALDHLCGHPLGNIGRGEPSILGRDLGMHRHLEQEVAQLFLYLAVVPGIDRAKELIGLLEQVGAQRFMRLLAVPGTTVRRPQAGDDLEDGLDARREGTITLAWHGL